MWVRVLGLVPSGCVRYEVTNVALSMKIGCVLNQDIEEGSKVIPVLLHFGSLEFIVGICSPHR